MNAVCRRAIRVLPPLVLAVLLGLPGRAAGQSASIEGTVTVDGAAAESVSVYAYLNCADYAGGAYTDATGWYQIGYLEAGTYCVQFEPWESGLAFEWYSNKRDQALADPIVVGVDEAVLNKDAQLERYGRITGTVTSDFGTLSGNVAVDVYDDGPEPVASGYLWTAPYDYAVENLPAGTYRVRFTAPPGWNSQWYNAKADRSASDPVNVQWGLTAGGINAQLVMIGRPATISGTVSAADGGDLAGPVAVTAFLDCGYDQTGSATADESGGYSYSLSGLPAGDYCLFFEYQGTGNFASEWHNNKRSKETSDLISAAEGAIVTVNAALDRFGALSGTVSSDYGALTGTVTVEVYVAAEPWPLTSVETDAAAGYGYTVANLAAWSDYRVRFVPSAPSWSPQWHLNKGSQAEADPVAVEWGATTTGIDAQLGYRDKPGSISGTVTTADNGIPAGGVMIRASGTMTREVTIDLAAGGAYTIGGLEAGFYTVSFVPPPPYLAEYYNNKFDQFESDSVQVRSNSDTPGIDGVLDRPGAISGQVKSSNGQPLVGDVKVEVFPASYGPKAGEATASAANDGAYRVAGLAADVYKVSFTPASSAYRPQWYSGRTEEYEADTVSVGLNQTVTGIDATLAVLGSISGKVGSASGAPLTGDVNVSVYDAAKASVVGAVTAVAANNYAYTVNGIEAGTYFVKFTPGTGWSPQWYDRKSDAYSATPVVMSGGEAILNVDASLEPPGGIQGTFAGVPFGEVMRVTVYDERGDQVASGTAGPPAYTYRIELPAGYFYWGVGMQNGSCFYDGGSCQGRTRVQVETGKFLTLDFTVPPWGRISGEISAASGGPFKGYASIFAEGLSSGSEWSFGGPYTIDCLSPGSYRVFFDPQHYWEEWFDNKPDQASATLVPVVAGQTTGAVNAVLDPLPNGGISGTVFPEAGSVFTDGVYVALQGAGTMKYAYVDQESDFTYAFDELDTGDYTIRFQPFDNHLSMWYQNSPDTPTVVHVTAGSTRTGIDTTLPVGGKIMGTVTDESGAPLAPYAVSVQVYTMVDGALAWVDSAYIDTATNRYEVDGLAAGSYYVYFSTGGSCPLYVSEWFDNVATAGAATPVNVALKGTATADATLQKLPTPGTIGGTVTVGGHPLHFSTQVVVYDLAGHEVTRHFLGLCQDRYEGCVPPGSYKVKFVPGDLQYANQWFNGKATGDYADTVVVNPGETKSNIDASIVPRGENHAPVLDPVGGKTVLEGQSLVFTLSASDGDGDSLTYGASNLPPWAELNATTGEVILAPPAGSAGSYAGVIFSVSDSSLVDTETITITVTALAVNRPPELELVGNRSVAEGTALIFTVHATDADGDSLTYAAENLPPWASFDPVSRTFSGSPRYRDAGAYPAVTFRVSDGTLTDSETIAITVVDKKPFFTDTFPIVSATGDADWKVRLGTWSVGADKTFAPNVKKSCLATVKVFDGPPPVFTIGTLSADISLVSGLSPNGFLVFAWTGNSNYRYAGIVKGKVVIGQVGTIGGTPPGVWSKAYPIALKKYPIKVAVLGTGEVGLFVGIKKIFAKKFAGAPPAGGVGLKSDKSKTLFDNVKVGN